MAYSNKEYFLSIIKEKELNNLLKDNSGTVQEEYLTKAVARADSLINSYLKSKVKTLPIPDDKVPETIKQQSYFIAMYYLHARIQYNDRPQAVKDDYDTAIAFLKDVANGRVDLDLSSLGEDETTETKSTAAYWVNDNWLDRYSF